MVSFAVVRELLEGADVWFSEKSYGYDIVQTECRPHGGAAGPHPPSTWRLVCDGRMVVWWLERRDGAERLRACSTKGQLSFSLAIWLNKEPTEHEKKLTREGKKIEAIKFYRERTQAFLTDAYKAMDRVSPPPKVPDRGPARRRVP